MTKDDIMKLALESGFAKILDEHASEYRDFTFELSQDQYPELGRFISLIAAHKAEVALAEAYRCGYTNGMEAALAQPPLPVQPEPVTWDKPSDNFNAWWDSDRRDNANPFEKDSAAYWAWAGWKAAQRPWVGLTDEDVKNLELTSATSSDVRNISAELKEKNT